MAGPTTGPNLARGATSEPQLDDWRLVDLAIGDPEAFEPLFTRYWDAVYRYCYYRLGNVEDAEDAAIQIFTNAYAALSRLSNKGKTFRSWLFVIAHNEVVNCHRNRTKYPEISMFESADRVDLAPSPEELALSASNAHETRQFVARLSERPRQVVELRLAGLSDVEIADVLDMSQGAVRQAQFRAIVQLRELMNVRGPEGRSKNV